MLRAVRAYSATADACGRASRKQQIREADEAIERANRISMTRSGSSATLACCGPAREPADPAEADHGAR